MEIAEWAASQLEYVVNVANKANQVAPQPEEEDELAQKMKTVDVTKMTLTLEKEDKESAKKENRFVKLLRRFDGYGDSEEAYDPVEYPKTASGGFVFILFRLVFAALIAWSIYNIASLETTVIPGDTTVLNVNQNSRLVQAGSSPVMDIPTLDFKIENTLTFYEKDTPTLQSIEVVDLTGYNPRYLSDLKEVPIARAMYEKQTLNLNSWDESTQVIKSPEMPIVSDLDAATVDSASHTFAESLKVFYKQGRVYGEVEDFYNHTTYIFVRFDASQLADIKMCQLQISMYNKGVFEVLKQTKALDERVYHASELFPTLETHPATWQPKYFIMDRELDEWKFRNPNSNLFMMKSAFTQDELDRFINSESWGPLNVNVTSVADLKLAYDEGGIHADDFLNWEYSISYVNNMKMTLEQLSCDGKPRFQSKFVLAYPLDAIQDYILLNTTVQPDFQQIVPFEILVSSAVDQEQMFVTGYDTDSSGRVKLLVERGDNEAPKDLRWFGDAFQCQLDTYPEFAPDEWSCDPSLYWNNDGCHCDCGAYDPDCCLQLSSDTYNCRSGEICSLKGFCVNTKVENYLQTWVSEGCESIYFAGEAALVGYVGTKDGFAADTNGICQPCVDDQYYDGSAQLTFESTFVCEIETTGYISGQLNDAVANQKADPYVEVLVYAETTPFPEKSFPYLVQVADTFGLEEILYVLNATTVKQDFQLLRLTNSFHQRPVQRFVSYARLFSACVSDSTTVVVQQHPLDTSFTDHFFSADGPYTVRIADREVVVADSSEVGSGNFQVLKLESKIDFEFGFMTTLLKPAKRGDSVIYVEPFEWWFDARIKNLSYPQRMPLTIRGPPGEYVGIELLYSSSYLSPNWTCDPTYYNADDGCDCNCGILDPDCLFPSPASFSGIVYDSSLLCFLDPDNCPPCEYCGFPNPVCTNSRPTETSLISPDETENVQVVYLATPLKFNHAAGYKVETPIPLPADPKDGLEDFESQSSSIYDVYSWIAIKRLADTEEYYPSDRYLPHKPELSQSPDPLEVEIAMFQIPDRNTFDTVKLCPGDNTLESEVAPVFNTHGWETWTVNDYINIRDCRMEAVDSNQCASTTKELPKDQYNVKCLKLMPPTHHFHYTTRVPVNNKWVWDGSGASLSNLPEYLIDVNHIYRFGYDNDVNEVEDEFATNAAPGGDVDSDGFIHQFFGEISNRGLGTGENLTAANVPYLSNVLTFVLSDTAIADIMKYDPVGYPTARSDIANLLSKMPEMIIEFDFDQLSGSTEQQNVPLEPGFAYFLTAEVAFEAIYKEGLLGSFGDPTMSSWNFRVITTSVNRVELDWFSRQNCEVRYTIKISPETKQVVVSYVTNLKSFIDSLGSAAGIVGAGVFLVSLYHYLTCQVSRQRKKKDKEDREKVVRAVLLAAIAEEMPELAMKEAAAGEPDEEMKKPLLESSAADGGEVVGFSISPSPASECTTNFPPALPQENATAKCQIFPNEVEVRPNLDVPPDDEEAQSAISMGKYEPLPSSSSKVSKSVKFPHPVEASIRDYLVEGPERDEMV